MVAANAACCSRARWKRAAMSRPASVSKRCCAPSTSTGKNNCRVSPATSPPTRSAWRCAACSSGAAPAPATCAATSPTICRKNARICRGAPKSTFMPTPSIVSATTPNAWRRGCGVCNPGSFPALGRDDRRATFPAGRRSVSMLMFRPSQLLRLLYINNVLLRHGLDDVVLATHLFRPVRIVRYLLPWHCFRRELPPRGVCIRRALDELGPIFIKFGHMLSTRPDLVPEDIGIELARLQDRVPPFPGVQARRIIEATLGRPVAQLFATFDETPPASASIAQVHLATLHDGREVVVKVVRPGILDTIARDIDLLYTVAALAERYWSEGKRLRPREVVREYEKTIVDELDLLREAANASPLRRYFQNSEILYVPEVYWPLPRKPVMVMERIRGIPISDIAALRRQGIGLKLLAERGVEIFFTRVFRGSFFHADMHPGNIFVSPHGQYIAVDFGIMGTLSPSDQRYLAVNFVAFFRRDYRRVAELHVMSGWVPEGTRIDEFESAIRTVCEPIFERPLKDISFGQFLLRLFQTARRFNMEVQPQLVLLQKTLLNVEGLGRDLYPDLDLWRTAKPFLERWMNEQVGVRAFMRSIADNAPRWAERLPEIPGLLHEVLKRAEGGKFKVVADDGDRRELYHILRRAEQRIYVAIIGAALVISAAVLLALDSFMPIMVGRATLLTWLLGVLGGILLMVAWPKVRD